MIRAARVTLARAPTGWPLLAASAVAWMLLIAAPPAVLMTDFCTISAIDWASVPARMTLALRLNPPSTMIAAALLMNGAMMLPLARSAIAELPAQPSARADTMATAWFLVGFGLASLLATAGIVALALALHLGTGGNGVAAFAIGVGVAMLWRACRFAPCCRIDRPAALPRGMTTAFACTAACWPLMMLPFLAGRAHLVTMAAATVLMILDDRVAKPYRA